MPSTPTPRPEPINISAMKAAMTAAPSGTKATVMATTIINALQVIADSNGGAVKNELSYIISQMKAELALMQTAVGA
jgi:hypothetical protein